MSSLASLSDTDLDLLVEMFCCVIAADSKVSGRELSVVTDTLTSLGHSPDANVLKTAVVGYCKAIHKKGVDDYVADLLQRARRLAGLPLATSFIEAQPTLLYADGASTPDEERVSQQIVECLSGVLAAAEDDPMSDVLLDEPGVTVGTSMLGTAKSSMALAAATAERTKLMTVTMPAAFIALGKQCFASKAFTAEFPINYAAIAKLAEETKATAEKLDTASTASTFAGRAKELASRGMTLAISQKQSVQYQKLMHDLGKAVYESKEAASGPKDLCERIAKCKQRLADLATTVTTHSRQLKSSAAGVGRSAVEVATSTAKKTRSPLAWSKKTIAAAALAGFFGLNIIGSWMDKPDGGLAPDADKPQATSSGSAVSAIDEKTVRAKATMVKNGMEFYEVTRLLGKPERRTAFNVKGSPEQTICWWMNGSLSVTFTKSFFGPIGGKVTEVLVGNPGYETAGTGFPVMQQRGRGGPGADQAVQNMINMGTYTREAEANIRGVIESAKRLDGER
jgi:hypothetical protein